VIPQGRPARLVTGRLFAISRNSMDVALTAVYCAAAILTVRAWPLVLLAVPVGIMQLVVIPFEEQRTIEALKLFIHYFYGFDSRQLAVPPAGAISNVGRYLKDVS
jgi:protein-S-isoprenylcysteine O-methyltransferase Ste14